MIVKNAIYTGTNQSTININIVLQFIHCQTTASQ